MLARLAPQSEARVDGVPEALAHVYQDFFTANSIFVASACGLLIWVSWQSYRRARVEFLRLWAASWASYLVARLVTMFQVRPRTGSTWDVLQPALSVVAQTGYYVHVWLLVVCLLGLAGGRSPKLGRRQLLGFGGGILALSVGLTMSTTGADTAVRIGVRIGLRCAVTAIAFGICGLLLLRYGTRIQRIGARFAGITLLFGAGAYAMHAWAYTSGTYFTLAAYLGSFEILVVSAIGLGLLLWLQEDRNRDAVRVNRELGERTQALLQAQRLESLGQLAGGISHDFNNVLTVMIANTELLLRHSGIHGRARAQIQETHDAALHAAKMTGQLLTLAREPASTRGVVELAAEAQAIKPLLRSLAGSRVRVHVEATDGPVRALLDRGHLEQVLINLVTNARDAITGDRDHLSGVKSGVSEGAVRPGGMESKGQGTILVSVLREDVSGVPYATISAADNGCGMTEEVRAQVGDLFFTTKGGRGTGMGMASVRSILAKTAGDLTIVSKPGEGSTVTVRWPEVDQGGETLGPDSASEARPQDGRRPTILLAEDDPMVRRVTARALENAGYVVIAEASAPAAMAQAKGYDGEIDLLLSDVVMPGIGGPDLAAQVREVRPTIAVRFISGYMDESQSAQLRELGPVLGKPFTRHELLAFVNDAHPGDLMPPLEAQP